MNYSKGFIRFVNSTEISLRFQLKFSAVYRGYYFIR